jgi:hypothetical protein
VYSVTVGTPRIGPGGSAGRHDPDDRAAPSGDANANSTENRRPIRQVPDSLRNLPTVLRPDTRNTLHFNRITKAAYATDNRAYSICVVFAAVRRAGSGRCVCQASWWSVSLGAGPRDVVQWIESAVKFATGCRGPGQRHDACPSHRNWSATSGSYGPGPVAQLRCVLGQLTAAAVFVATFRRPIEVQLGLTLLGKGAGRYQCRPVPVRAARR